MGYSVLTEPVIPVLMPDGEERSVGIREAILEAHQIRDVSGGNPLERYAVLRLLIAFAMDMLHPKDSYERADLLEQGRFIEKTFDEYVRLCEKDGPRFDLFDASHPFMQSAYDEKLDANAKKPAAVILHALPSGNNHVFIDHRPADSHRFSIPEAFRALCASYVFCVSGLAGPSSVNNTPPLFAVAIRPNLFETIMANMVSQAEAEPLPYGEGETAWRTEQAVIPRKEVPAVSLLEGLTWRPRRITLIRDNVSDTVREVYCQAGLNFQGNDLWNDPHVPRFRKKDDTFGTVKPELDKEIWRDAGSLLYDHDSRYVRQPLAVRCLQNLYEEDEMPEWIQIRASGLITNQAAYTGWCEGVLSLPSVLLYDEEKATVFRKDIRLIEDLQGNIYRNVQKNVDRLRASGVGEEHAIASQCRQYFLKEAHDYLFGEDLNSLVKGVPPDEHDTALFDALKGIIRDMLKKILYASGDSTKAVMSQIEAEKWIWQNFNKMMKERMDDNAGS